jgi:hypothetical protein
LDQVVRQRYEERGRNQRSRQQDRRHDPPESASASTGSIGDLRHVESG